MKKNRYLVFLFLICFFLTLRGVYASEDCNQSCKIQDGPAPALTEYFTNIDTLIGKISEGLSNAQAVEDGDEQERKKVL